MTETSQRSATSVLDTAGPPGPPPVERQPGGSVGATSSGSVRIRAGSVRVPGPGRHRRVLPPGAAGRGRHRRADTTTAQGGKGGVLLGLAGVLVFSLTLPATRVAVTDMDPWFVAFARMMGAGFLAFGYLWATRAPVPDRSQLRKLAVVALGVVVGFPVFSSLALATQTASHGAVVTALLPTATAVFAVLRGGERPRVWFWCASFAGLVAILFFVTLSSSLSGGLQLADLFLLLAVVFGGLGYAEGGGVARQLGGPQTICWALMLSLPVGIPVTLAVGTATDALDAAPSAWLGLAYVVVFSMFLGFFAWYAGLARGGVARVGQLQLAQPVLTLGWSVLLLGETVDSLTLLVGVLVLVFTVLIQRTR